MQNNGHHYLLEHIVMSSNVLVYLTSSPKAEDIEFTIMI